MRRALLPWIALVALVGLAAASVARADDGDDPRLVGDDEERAALESASTEKWVRAREQAEAILARRRDSFLATWVLAQVHHYSEGNHARALFLVRRAASLLARWHGAEPTDPLAVKWHKDLLEEEASVLLEMDRPEEVIAALDRHDALYTPKLHRRRVWPLMKLRRFDEARRYSRELAEHDRIHERISGWNGLIAIDGEAHEREAAWRDVVEGMAATQEQACILAHNGASTALMVFRFAEAEAYAKKALAAPIKDCPVSTYDRLAGLYLLEGEFQKAISAIAELKAAPVEKQYRAEFAVRNREHMGRLLYAIGKLAEAERLAGDLHDLPARTGMTSTSRNLAHLDEALFLWIVLDARLAEEAERAAARPFWQRLGAWATSARLGLRRWEIGRQLRKLAASDGDLVSVLKPYVGNVWPWYSASLARVLGPGVLAKAIAMARAVDSKLAATGPYYDALDAEVAFVRGDLEAAARLAGAALDGIAPEDGLLRRRLAAIRADVLWRQGRGREAAELFFDVVERFPMALRIQGVRLPVTISSDGSPDARAAAARVAGSPRFGRGDSGLRIEAARAAAGGVELCLTDASGRRLSCGASDPGARGGDAVTRAVERFHDAVFSAKVDMTQSDINSLDGSPTRVDADAALEGLLGKP